MIELRRLEPDDWPVWRAVRLQALAEAPDAFSAALADWQGDGDAEARWRQRLDAVPLNIVAIRDDRPVGQVSGTHVDVRGFIQLISLWVAPDARGLGVGEQLIDAVVQWALDQEATGMALAVRRANHHAIALYERAGFVHTDAPAAPDEEAMLKTIGRA